MKTKKYLFIIISILFLGIINVYAKSDIYSIKMDIYLEANGNARITEYWDVKAESGTEWFKQMKNLDNMEVLDFQVAMDSQSLTQKTWDVNETLEQKKGYYGINKIDNGLELCFGKYDYQRHVFTLSYTLTNTIIETSDSQVFIGQLVNKMPDHNFKDVQVTISGFYYFPDTLDVWGTGYKGLAYVSEGKMHFTNETKGDMGEDSYVSVLAKFPVNTFTSAKKVANYEVFDDVKKAYDEGRFDYEKNSIWKTLLPIVLFITGFTLLANYLAKKTGYGYINNKKIIEKETNAFRDIPCQKDLFLGNALIKLNNFGYKETNIFGAIILKWVKEGKITFKKEEKKGLFKTKEECTIDMTSNPTFTNISEQKMWNIMYEASEDGILENNELKRFSERHPDRFNTLFNEIIDDEINKLKKEQHIYKRKDKSECKYGNVMDDMLYEEASHLLGLKIFFKEFASMEEKETIEVHLWDEYLMFAYLFGMADKVFDQLKKLYPEIIEQDVDNYHNMMMATTFANTTINSSLRAAQNYHAGGGGFSSGGGGGGGFGGGVSGGR